MSSPALSQDLSPFDTDASEIRIQRASPQQPEQALELIEEYYEALEAVMRDDRTTIVRYMADTNSAVWVARAGSFPAGYIVYRALPGIDSAGELKRLYVRPAFRGRGVAKELLRVAEDFACARNLCNIYLDTNERFRGALIFYKRNGYLACDRYNDNPQATVFMRKRLPGRVIVGFRAGG